MNLKMVLLISNGLRNSGSWAVSRSERNTELPMNRTPSPHPSPPVGERVPEGRVRGILRGSWSQCAVAEPWRLSMNRKVGRAVLCAPTPATTLSCGTKDDAHGVTRPTSANSVTAPMLVECRTSKLSMSRRVAQVGSGVPIRKCSTTVLIALCRKVTDRRSPSMFKRFHVISFAASAERSVPAG